jgi:hypothetical protein
MLRLGQVLPSLFEFHIPVALILVNGHVNVAFS